MFMPFKNPPKIITLQVHITTIAKVIITFYQTYSYTFHPTESGQSTDPLGREFLSRELNICQEHTPHGQTTV